MQPPPAAIYGEALVTHLKAVFVIDHSWLHSQQRPQDDVLYAIEQFIGSVNTCTDRRTTEVTSSWLKASNLVCAPTSCSTKYNHPAAIVPCMSIEGPLFSCMLHDAPITEIQNRIK